VISGTAPPPLGAVHFCLRARTESCPKMPSALYDVEHWVARAERARAMANRMTAFRTRRMMLTIAEGYDDLAEFTRRIDMKEQSKSPPKPFL
jgi:hypothetical protein